MSTSLTAGSVSSIHNGNDVKDPIVQVMTCRRVDSRQPRYRILLSDGAHYLQGMLATQLNFLCESGKIVDNTIICVKEIVCNVVHNKKVAIVLSLDIVAQSATPIGNPVAVDGSAGPPQKSAPPQQQAAPPTSSSSVSGGGSHNPYATGTGGGSMYNGGGGGGGSSAILPIAHLNPYQNNWTIKARVTNKSDTRHYSNAKGEGKLASIDLLDAQGGEIRATMFNEQVDSLYPMLQKNSVYLISGGSLKQANRKYTSLRNQYEITFGSQTTIERAPDDGAEIKLMQYNVTPIDSITRVEKDELIDVIGIVINTGELGEITTRKGAQLAKRAITLLDQTAHSIECTLWGSNAENFSAAGAPVLAAKGVRVSDYGGRTLSTMGSSSINLNPDVPEAKVVREWYDKQGGVANIKVYPLSQGGGGGGGGGGRHTEFLTLAHVIETRMGQDKPEYFECEVVGTRLNHENTWMYNSCSGADCRKKVSMDHNNLWRCETCNQSRQTCEPRYVLSMTASDATGRAWFSLFNDEAAALLGKSAAEMVDLQQNDPSQFEKVFADATFKTLHMKVRAKSETYQEKQTIKYAVNSFQTVDWLASAQRIAAELEQMKPME